MRKRWVVKIKGGPDLEVKGNILDHEYTIGEGRDKVAEVSKKWFRLRDTGGFLALLLFIFGSLVIGMVLGGRDPTVRNVMGLGTATRNVSAAIVVAAQNFSGTNTLTLILVAAILLLLILLPTAKRMGARSQAAALA